MTAFDPEIISRRLNKLQQTVNQLEKERPASPEEIAQKDVLSDATLYRVQTGIEAIIDIGSHILAEVFEEHQDTYKDVILELGKKGVVPSDFARQNTEMVDFRNILVHHYVDLDPDKAYVNIEKAPEVLGEFARHLAIFLEKQIKKSKNTGF